MEELGNIQMKMRSEVRSTAKREDIDIWKYEIDYEKFEELFKKKESGK